MPELDQDIDAFAGLRAELEAHHMGEWVLIRERQLINTFPSFEDAAQVAVENYGRGPYLIRQVGASPVVLPASVMYHPTHG